MKRILLAGAGAVMLATAGVALAQTPPAPPPGGPQAAPPPPPPGQEMMGRPMMGGPMMGRGPGRFGPRGEMHPPKGAVLSFRKDDARIFVKCPDDEQMKACVEALSTVLDKLGSLQGQTH